MGMNETLGLPFGKMQKVVFAFDVDGTLINEEEKHVETIKLLVAMGEQKWKNVKVAVWSGGGRQYAETFVHRLGLENHVDMVLGKLDHQRLHDEGYMVVAVDDIQDTAIGDINLIVRNK
jgi:phosphoserine phosphatase